MPPGLQARNTLRSGNSTCVIFLPDMISTLVGGDGVAEWLRVL